MSDSAAATPGAGDARAARLRSAGDAARQEGGAPPGEAVLPCQRGQALEVRVLDERGGPVADVVVELARGQDQVLRRRSDARGRARFEGLEPGAAL
ncbi:MAG TPA: carboxypeptidase-like regulatory domain-containing protein, partial [Longimicrobium sp.]